MKHLRGGEYVTPNVSLITDNNSVMFNPAPPPIIISTFKIELVTSSYSNREYVAFNFEVGMTLGEWVNSEYNVLVNNKKVRLDETEGYLEYNGYRTIYLNLQNVLLTESSVYSCDEPN